MAPKTSKRPVTREDAKRLAAKRKRVSESPGMTKRLNQSGATGNKGSRFGAEETANMMATDPARGGTNPKEERDRKKAQAFFDSVLKKAYGGTMKKKGMAKGGAVTKKKAGGAVTKKMNGGTMKKKGMAKGGKLAKMNPGGRLNMVKNKAGKMVPDFAADGKGKMAKGGAVAKKKVGGAVTKKMGGGKMMKKGYAKGGKLAKKMGKGGTLVRGTGAQRSGRMARGPMG